MTILPVCVATGVLVRARPRPLNARVRASVRGHSGVYVSRLAGVFWYIDRARSTIFISLALAQKDTRSVTHSVFTSLSLCFTSPSTSWALYSRLPPSSNVVRCSVTALLRLLHFSLRDRTLLVRFPSVPTYIRLLFSSLHHCYYMYMLNIFYSDSDPAYIAILIYSMYYA